MSFIINNVFDHVLESWWAIMYVYILQLSKVLSVVCVGYHSDAADSRTASCPQVWRTAQLLRVDGEVVVA